MSGVEIPIIIISVGTVVGGFSHLTRNIKSCRLGGCMDCNQAVDPSNSLGPPPDLTAPNLGIEDATRQSKHITWKQRLSPRRFTPRRRKKTPPQVEEDPPPPSPTSSPE